MGEHVMAATRVPAWRVALALMAIGALVVLAGPALRFVTTKALGK